MFKVPVGSSPVLGSPSALVTIVEFSDFQCPFCGRVVDTMAQLQKDYGEQTLRTPVRQGHPKTGGVVAAIAVTAFVLLAIALA